MSLLPRLVSLGLMLVFASLLAACGGEGDGEAASSSSAEAGAVEAPHATTEGAGVPALDPEGLPGQDPMLESRSASLIFWRPLRQSALELGAALEAGRLAPWGPGFLDVVETRIRKDILKVKGLDPERSQRWITLKRMKLKEPYRIQPRVVDFESASAKQRWSATTHRLSPSLQVQGLRAVAAEEWSREPASAEAAPLLIVSRDVPSLATLADAAKKGVVAWAYRASAEESQGQGAGDVASVRPDPAGLTEEALPLPLIYIGNLAAGAIVNRSTSGGFSLDLRVVGLGEEAPAAEALVLRVSPEKARSRVVVTVGRRDAARGTGSASLAAARLIAVARSFALQAAAANKPQEFSLAMDFVFVVDGRQGWDFLAELDGPGSLLGVLDLGTGLPQDAKSRDIVVGVNATTGRLEGAALSAARAYARRPAQAWNLIGFDALEMGGALRRKDGRRLPVVGLDLARPRERRRLSPPAGVEAEIRGLEYAPAQPPEFGSPRDRVETAVRGQVPASVAQARLAAITLIRLQAGL